MEWLDLRPLLLAALILIPLERLLPHRTQAVFRKGWLNDLAGYALVNAVVVRIGLVAMAGLGLAIGEALVPTGFRADVAAAPLWLQPFALLLVGDLSFYAVHRLFHRVPALWRFHAVHHSIEEMDWLAGHRVHPLDQILTKGASLTACFAIGFSGWAVGVWLIAYQCHSLLLHSNLRLGFGPLRWLVASPQFHHWHHSNEREAWDRNFGAQLPLWDMLFGTAFMPKGRSTSGFGISDPVPATYPAQLLYPFSSEGRAAGADSASAANQTAG